MAPGATLAGSGAPGRGGLDRGGLGGTGVVRLGQFDPEDVRQRVVGGLEARGGAPLKGSAIAGADKKFVWASAKIGGNGVVVSSDKVKTPVAVRYAWGSSPECNLFNKEGLPASPFRTDDW